MARLISEGFEGGDTLFWSAAVGSNTASNVRSGSRAWVVGNGDSKTLPATYSEFYFRAALRFSAVNAGPFPLFDMKTGTTIVIQVTVNADNTISVYSNAGATLQFTTTYTVTASTYYLFELRVLLGGAGVGITTLKIDGIQRGTNVATANNQNGSTIDRFAFRYTVNTIDDLAFNDTTTASDNSWPGDGHIITQLPTGAGNSTQWTPSAGANWQNVDEVPPNGDTDYNSVATTNQRDDYALANSGLSGVTISRVWAEMVSKIDVADGSTAGMYIRAGTTNYDDANGLLAQTLSYSRYKSAEWLVNPDTTVAWIVADLDALNAGIRT